MKYTKILLVAIAIYMLLRAIDDIYGNVIINNFKIIICIIGGVFIFLGVIMRAFWKGYYLGQIDVEGNFERHEYSEIAKKLKKQ